MKTISNPDRKMLLVERKCVKGCHTPQIFYLEITFTTAVIGYDKQTDSKALGDDICVYT